MPVLALSQLSRAIEQRGKDKRPMLSDLRDSGAIEQDADIVMFIDRSMNEIEAESESRPDLGMAKLIVAKHRNGATRDIDLAFNPEFTKFMDFIDDSRQLLGAVRAGNADIHPRCRPAHRCAVSRFAGAVRRMGAPFG